MPTIAMPMVAPQLFQFTVARIWDAALSEQYCAIWRRRPRNSSAYCERPDGAEHQLGLSGAGVRTHGNSWSPYLYMVIKPYI